MAYQFDVNGTIPGTGAACLFRMKTLLKTMGWTVKSSSDGTTYNSTGDQITQGGTGAGGMANNAAWFRIQQPGANGREFTVQGQGVNTYLARIKYSGGPSTGFTGGSPGATQTPSATDEKIILGGGTDAAPTYAQFIQTPESSQRFNMLAGDSASNYNFLWWTQTTGDNWAYTGMYLDVLVSGTYPLADVDPAVVYMDGFSSLIFNQNIGNVGGSTQCWFNKGLGGAAFQPVGGAYYYAPGAVPIFPTQGGQNHITGKDDFAPIVYMRPSNLVAPYGFKGVSSLLVWNSVARGYGDTFNVVSTKDYLALGWQSTVYVAIPWNGSDLLI